MSCQIKGVNKLKVLLSSLDFVLFLSFPITSTGIVCCWSVIRLPWLTMLRSARKHSIKTFRFPLCSFKTSRRVSTPFSAIICALLTEERQARLVNALQLSVTTSRLEICFFSASSTLAGARTFYTKVRIKREKISLVSSLFSRPRV